MSALVVHSSVVVGWLLADQANDYTTGVAEAIEEGMEPWAPELFLWEISNLLLESEREGLLSTPIAEKMLTTLAALPWRFENPSGFVEMEEISQLSRKHGLTVYEAAYLYLAKEEKLPLAAQNARLIAAAGKEEVEVIGE